MTAVPQVTFARVVRSEWTKLRSLRSSWIVLGGAALLTVGFAGVIGWVASREPEPPTVDTAVGGAFLGVDLFSLVVGVFGVLLMTGEYGSGLIRATLTAVPRRLPVLWAKALVLLAATGAVMATVSLVSFLTHQAFAAAGERIALGDPGALRAVLGAAAAPVAWALLGLAIGTILRHTAAAITVYVATLLVLPALLPVALPEPVRDDIIPYVPLAASQAMYEMGDSNPFRTLSPGAGALVMLGWVALALAGGAVTLYRRDA
jgi:hypothetical protein